MANELDNALQAGLNILRNINGLRSSPDFSPENPNTYPLLVGSAFEGYWLKEASEQVKGIHTVRFGVYVPRKDLPRDIEAAMPFGELVKDQLFHDDNTRWGSTIDTVVDRIDYTFGEILYAQQSLLGWTFRVPVKIRSIQSGDGYVKG